MSYLTANELDEIVNTFIDSGAIANPRSLLFSGVRPSFVAGLNLDPAPIVQLRLDLNRLNGVARLEDGSVPLALYLRNAAQLIRDLPESAVLKDFMSKVTNAASGLAPLAPLATLPAAVLTKEAVIHQDDTVDLGFIRACLSCTKSVARLVVPRFDNGDRKLLGNGKPWLFNGSGWLLGSDVLITNQHVINSRSDGEAAAAPADFERQARETEVQFDFDTAGGPVVGAAVKAVEAVDAGLDFCVLRLTAPTQRPGLKLLPNPVAVNDKTYLPLNIIQHPLGGVMRVAIRNNLAVDADADVVRYYSDTDAGSSGSPVFDDSWKVVALHRGAMLRQAKFQGKDTAFVNVGSQISRVVGMLRATKPGLCTELGI
jgi:endonuclease G